ncbi:MAG: hypothetical protein RSE54_01270 [Ruthenibacterium sp.]
MILFTKDGHLTDEALQATIAEKLDELARLEVAEHLSFCNPCLTRYTAMLTDETLRTPEAPLMPPLLSRIRRRTVGLLFNRYTTYAAAACLALVLWGAGVFTQLGARPESWRVAAAAPNLSISAMTGDFLNVVGDTLNSAMDTALQSVLPQRSGKPAAANPMIKE